MSNKRLQMQRRTKPAPQKPKPMEAAPFDDIAVRINQYRCELCGGVITTIDRHEGVTPMMLACRATEGCPGTSWSRGYTVDQTLTPDYEWYRPAKLPKNHEARQYIEMGGLDIRKIVKNEA